MEQHVRNRYSLAELLGVCPGPIQWQRPFFWLAAFYASRLCVGLFHFIRILWYWVSHPEKEFYLHNFSSYSFYSFLVDAFTLEGSLKLIVFLILAMWLFRINVRPLRAALTTVVVYIPVSLVLKLVLGQLWFLHLRVEQSLSPEVFAVFFLVSLLFTLHWCRHLWTALMIGFWSGPIATWVFFKAWHTLAGIDLQDILPRLFDFRLPLDNWAWFWMIALLLGGFCWSSVFCLLCRISREPAPQGAGARPGLRWEFYLGSLAAAVPSLAYDVEIQIYFLLQMLEPQYSYRLHPWGFGYKIHPMGFGEKCMAALGAWFKPTGGLLEWFKPMGGLLEWVLWLFLVYYLVVLCLLLYKLWSAIQDPQSRITPSRAVGYLFIPVLNIFWSFRTFASFACEYNAYLLRHGIDLPRLSPMIGIVAVVLSIVGIILGIIPWLGLVPRLVAYVLFLVMMARYADAVSLLVDSRTKGRKGSQGED